MIRQVLTAGVSATALALATPAAAQEAADAAIAPPTMNFGAWGVDPATIDSTVDPGDDFFAYVNGKWVRENPMPAEYSRFGAFDILGEKSTSDVKRLVDDLVASDPAPATPERRIVDAYLAFEDTAAIEAAGLAPAQPYLAQIRGAATLEQLAELFTRAGFSPLVAAGVTVDSKDPNSYIVAVGFDGMGLPDRDYYLVESDRNREVQARYKEFLTAMLGQAGVEDPAGMAQRVYAFEHRVAELEWARQALRNRDLTYNKLTRAELDALDPGFPLASVLRSAKFDQVEHFLVAQLPPDQDEIDQLGLTPDYLSGIGGGLPAMMQLLRETPLETLKAYMAVRFLVDHAAVLPKAIDDANFAFYGTFLSGQPEQRPRWKRAIAATEGQLGEQLGVLYAARYFPPESKAAMDELVGNLRKALAESIAENDWMTEATKREAFAKLEAFTPRIGYPDDPETYEGLVIRRDDPMGNRLAAIAWQQEDSRARLGKPVDKTEWGMLAQTVNASYTPVFNAITFPGGILQQPFFGLSADPAVNYGAIGGVIGHEIGHGFDDQGAKSDGSGTLRNWWAEEDLRRFTALGDKLVAQYDAICPWDDGTTCVRGRQTLGENIGDVGGLSMAYRAYRMSLGGKEAPIIDGFTGDQRFFLAWAQVWRTATREAAARQRLMTDVHSPPEARVNGVVRNQDAWYEAFGVTPDDVLYLPPEERVRIW
jgi:putative endopeptidase